MNKKSAEKKLKGLVEEAMARIKEAESLADDHGLTFRVNLGWGMGGEYHPNPAKHKQWEGDFEDYDFLRVDDEGHVGFSGHWGDYGADDEHGFWYSSSMGCS